MSDLASRYAAFADSSGNVDLGNSTPATNTTSEVKEDTTPSKTESTEEVNEDNKSGGEDTTTTTEDNGKGEEETTSENGSVGNEEYEKRLTEFGKEKQSYEQRIAELEKENAKLRNEDDTATPEQKEFIQDWEERSNELCNSFVKNGGNITSFNNKVNELIADKKVDLSTAESVNGFIKITDLKNPGLVFDVISKNKEYNSVFFKSTAYRQNRILKEIQEDISAGKYKKIETKSKALSNAPPPTDIKVGGKGESSTTIYNKDLSFEEYAKLRAKK